MKRRILEFALFEGPFGRVSDPGDSEFGERRVWRKSCAPVKTCARNCPWSAHCEGLCCAKEIAEERSLHPWRQIGPLLIGRVRGHQGHHVGRAEGGYLGLGEGEADVVH